MKYRLALFDMDSTLINEEIIDELAASAGKKTEVSKITERAMHGELDFKSALRERVALLKGLKESSLSTVSSKVTFSEGAKATIEKMKSLGMKVGVVSGGFHEVIDPVLSELELDLVSANSLEVREGVLTGKVIGPIIDAEGKKNTLLDFAQRNSIRLDETIAIGDGANDIQMIQLAGLGVSFRGKEVLNAHAAIVLNNSMTEIFDYLTD
jgi:phosphoserine phosphatase